MNRDAVRLNRMTRFWAGIYWERGSDQLWRLSWLKLPEHLRRRHDAKTGLALILI